MNNDNKVLKIYRDILQKFEKFTGIYDYTVKFNNCMATINNKDYIY